MKLKNKTILVTGALGFVGSHVVEALIKEQAHIIATTQTADRKSYFYQQNLNKHVTLVPLDVNDFDKVFHTVTKFKVDYIFHLAAQPIVEVAYNNPRETLKTNILGTINILESARLFPHVQGVIVASSDKAYGKLKRGTYKETDSLKGDHPYEVSKSAADLICTSYYKTYGTPVVVTRFGNIYGEGDLNYSRIIPGIMQTIITGDVLDIRSDGTFIRDYLYVKDVAEGYIRCAKKINLIKGQAFNFGSPETLSVLALIKKIEKTLEISIPYTISNTAKNEIPYQSLNFKKAQRILGWKQKYSLKNTIPNIYSYYKTIL